MTAAAPGSRRVPAARHGDARRALDLLRVSAEIAERNQESRVTEQHVVKAKNKIELDCVSEAMRTLPTQSKLVLMGIFLNEESGNARLTTGDVYDTYKEICKATGLAVLTQRRITDLISELDMLGLIHARVKSFGRGGRTKEIEASVPIEDGMRALEEDPAIQQVRNFKPKVQSTLM